MTRKRLRSGGERNGVRHNQAGREVRLYRHGGNVQPQEGRTRDPGSFAIQD